MTLSSDAVFVQLFTRDPLVQEATRALVLARLARLLPAMGSTPQRGFRTRPESLSERQDFLWTGEDGAIQAAVNPVFYPTDTHSVISLEIPLRLVDTGELVAFVRELGESLDADFGYVTVLAEHEGVLPTMYLTQLDLRRWLPEVWHGLLLGGPYLELIGADRIRRTPAHTVARSGPHAFWVQLGPLVVSRREPEQQAERDRRETVRDHLGPDLFWRPDRRVYRTPAFAPSGPRTSAGRSTEGVPAGRSATFPGTTGPIDPGMP